MKDLNKWCDGGLRQEVIHSLSRDEQQAKDSALWVLRQPVGTCAKVTALELLASLRADEELRWAAALTSLRQRKEFSIPVTYDQLLVAGFGDYYFAGSSPIDVPDLRTGNQATRLEAAQTLWYEGKFGALRALREASAREKKPKVQKALLLARASLGDVEVTASLLQLIEDRDQDLMNRAIQSLGRLGDLRALPTLLELYHEGYQTGIVAGALAEFGSAVAPAVLDLIEAKPELASRQAMSTILSHGDQASLVQEMNRRMQNRPKLAAAFLRVSPEQSQSAIASCCMELNVPSKVHKQAEKILGTTEESFEQPPPDSELGETVRSLINHDFQSVVKTTDRLLSRDEPEFVSVSVYLRNLALRVVAKQGVSVPSSPGFDSFRENISEWVQRGACGQWFSSGLIQMQEVEAALASASVKLRAREQGTFVLLDLQLQRDSGEPWELVLELDLANRAVSWLRLLPPEAVSYVKWACYNYSACYNDTLPSMHQTSASLSRAGFVCFQNGLPRYALALIRRARELDPSAEVPAASYKALIAKRIEEPEDAERFLASVLVRRVHPDIPEPRLGYRSQLYTTVAYTPHDGNFAPYERILVPF